jgi:hypothetical protein
MNIFIKKIPHSLQRYPTVGDWYWDDGALFITVSQMDNWKYEFLVTLHELAEVHLCIHSGIEQSVVDAFDIKFEKKRKKGNTDEPGDDPKCPYRTEHLIATGIEKVAAAFLGVCWKDYEEKVNSL